MSKAAVLLLVWPLVALAQTSDLKILSVASTNLSAMHQTIQAKQALYFHGQRQRLEEGDLATIYQCDLQQVVYLLPDKTYRVEKLGPNGMPPLNREQQEAVKSRKQHFVESGVKVSFIVEAVDSGEQRYFYGIPARHLVQKARLEPQETSCSHYTKPADKEGWYVDAPAPLYCGGMGSMVFNRRHVVFEIRPNLHLDSNGYFGCMDQVERKYSGPQGWVIPVEETVVNEVRSGKDIMHSQAVEVSTQPLDPTLFEIPPGYKPLQIPGKQP